MASEEARAKGEETRAQLDEFWLDAKRRIGLHERLFLVVRRRRIEGATGERFVAAAAAANAERIVTAAAG